MTMIHSCVQVLYTRRSLKKNKKTNILLTPFNLLLARTRAEIVMLAVVECFEIDQATYGRLSSLGLAKMICLFDTSVCNGRKAQSVFFSLLIKLTAGLTARDRKRGVVATHAGLESQTNLDESVVNADDSNRRAILAENSSGEGLLDGIFTILHNFHQQYLKTGINSDNLDDNVFRLASDDIEEREGTASKRRKVQSMKDSNAESPSRDKSNEKTADEKASDEDRMEDSDEQLVGTTRVSPNEKDEGHTGEDRTVENSGETPGIKERNQGGGDMRFKQEPKHEGVKRGFRESTIEQAAVDKEKTNSQKRYEDFEKDSAASFCALCAAEGLARIRTNHNTIVAHRLFMPVCYSLLRSARLPRLHLTILARMIFALAPTICAAGNTEVLDDVMGAIVARCIPTRRGIPGCHVRNIDGQTMHDREIAPALLRTLGICINSGASIIEGIGHVTALALQNGFAHPALDIVEALVLKAPAVLIHTPNLLSSLLNSLKDHHRPNTVFRAAQCIELLFNKCVESPLGQHIRRAFATFYRESARSGNMPVEAPSPLRASQVFAGAGMCMGMGGSSCNSLGDVNVQVTDIGLNGMEQVLDMGVAIDMEGDTKSQQDKDKSSENESTKHDQIGAMSEDEKSSEPVTVDDKKKNACDFEEVMNMLDEVPMKGDKSDSEGK